MSKITFALFDLLIAALDALPVQAGKEQIDAVKLGKARERVGECAACDEQERDDDFYSIHLSPFLNCVQ